MSEIPTSSVETVDTSYLETLVGYNARRTALKAIAMFLERMAPLGLIPLALLQSRNQPRQIAALYPWERVSPR